VTQLQPRQLACLRLAAEGLGYVEIGQQLHIARSTVKTQLKRCMVILDARNTTQAVHIAHQRGLLDDRRTA
jgi:DNA-binding CsgD family transcriptional regulator